MKRSVMKAAALLMSLLLMLGAAACGGKASPAHGTDGSGYRLLEAFGHPCTALHPALVQLRTDPEFVRGLKGLRAAVTLTLRTPDGGTHA